jgi:hypothetical protein
MPSASVSSRKYTDNLIALVDGEPAAAGKKRTYFLIGEGRESRIEVPIIALIQTRGPARFLRSRSAPTPIA